MNTDESGSEPTATDDEIERQRARWAREQRAKHLDFVNQFPFHTSTTFMDYLHGDVDAEEAELACRYEYARELKAIWEAAKQRDEWRSKGLEAFSDTDRAAWEELRPAERNEKAALYAYQASQLHDQTSFPFDTLNFLVCESFPKKDWKALSPTERKAIARFKRKQIPPLSMTDVWTLKALSVFDTFKAMGEAAKPVVENVQPGKMAEPMKLVWPVLQKSESVYYAVFDVDYSKGEAQLVNEFREWLRLPENRERLEQYKKPKIGTTGKALDRLKDLASWRLYRELDNDWNAANEFANHHRKQFTAQEISEKYKTEEQREKYHHGDPRPFRDAKQQEGKPPNEADLFGEDSDARKAQASAWEFLTQIMPEKLAPPGPLVLAAFVELEKLASEG